MHMAEIRKFTFLQLYIITCIETRLQVVKLTNRQASVISAHHLFSQMKYFQTDVDESMLDSTLEVFIHAFFISPFK